METSDRMSDGRHLSLLSRLPSITHEHLYLSVGQLNIQFREWHLHALSRRLQQSKATQHLVPAYHQRFEHTLIGCEQLLHAMPRCTKPRGSRSCSYKESCIRDWSTRPDESQMDQSVPSRTMDIVGSYSTAHPFPVRSDLSHALVLFY